MRWTTVSLSLSHICSKILMEWRLTQSNRMSDIESTRTRSICLCCNSFSKLSIITFRWNLVYKFTYWGISVLHSQLARSSYLQCNIHYPIHAHALHANSTLCWCVQSPWCWRRCDGAPDCSALSALWAGWGPDLSHTCSGPLACPGH